MAAPTNGDAPADRDNSPIAYEPMPDTELSFEETCSGEKIDRVRRHERNTLFSPASQSCTLIFSIVLGRTFWGRIEFLISLERTFVDNPGADDLSMTVACNASAINPNWSYSFEATVKCQAECPCGCVFPTFFDDSILSKIANKYDPSIVFPIGRWPDNCDLSSIKFKINFKIRSWKGIYPALEHDFTAKTDISDATLVVEGTRLFVSRSILAFTSKFFHSLFFGNKDEVKEEFQLDDISLIDIRLYLMITYTPIAEDTKKIIYCVEQIERMLTLAEKLESTTLTRIMEMYLCREIRTDFREPLSVIGSLLIADKFHLSSARSRILGNIQTLQGLGTQDEYSGLNNAWKVKIMDACMGNVRNAQPDGHNDDDRDDRAVPTTSQASGWYASAGVPATKRRRI